jgi:hypothetical protein
MAIVVARHVMLLEGKQIITWTELEDRIAALPDPSLAHPSFYVTRGARDAGLADAAKAEIWKLHQKFQLQGHSEGSLWPRSDVRYDRIEDADDLLPDERLRVEGTVFDKDGQPAADAEVLLVAPVDASIPYKTYHMALVRGRVRNRLEHVMTDSDAAGQFELYPAPGEAYYVVALHPEAGFALVSSDDEQYVKDHRVELAPWAGLVSRLAAEPGRDQAASIDTKVPARDAFPEIEIDQYWSEQKEELPPNFYGFAHVPPNLETAISRSFPDADGAAVSVPGATVTLLPGEIRRLDFGKLSDERRALLERVQREFQQRRAMAKAAIAPPPLVAPPNAAEGSDPPPSDAAATDAATDAADAFGERFLVMQVTTDLERRLLGNHDGPSLDASACVFVDSREFAGDASLSAKSRPFLLLAAWLEEQAKVDDRLVKFKVVDVVENEAFDAVKARAEALSKICDQLGREAGYRQVKSTQTYGVDLKERIDEAQAAARKQAADGLSAPPTDKSFAGNERLGVYAVRTTLERLLVHADCVVDIRPVLRQSEGNHFPDDFVFEMQQLLPQVRCDDQRVLLLDIHYIEAVGPHIFKWVNDRAGRLAFAKQLGFEDCHLQMSQTDDVAPGTNDASEAKPATP